VIRRGAQGFGALLALSALAAAAPEGPALRAAASTYAAADRALAQQDFALARDLTRELITSFPTDPELWRRLATAEQRLGRFAEALSAYDQAIDAEAAFSADGGRQLAQLRFQRATLLLAEAERELKGNELALGAPFDSARAELRRVLRLIHPWMREEPPVEPRRDSRPVRGYVVETPAGAKPNAAKESNR
jgi:tetratricopeptide (TPR) repeat protein